MANGVTGRPFLLTEDLLAQIVRRVREGAAFSQAYALNRISLDTGQTWRSIGNAIIRAGRDCETENEAMCVRLVREMDEARDAYCSELQNIILDAAKTKPECWQAASRILESRKPINYNKNAFSESEFRTDKNLSLPDQIKQIHDAVEAGILPSEEGGRRADILMNAMKAAQDELVKEMQKYVEIMREKAKE